MQPSFGLLLGCGEMLGPDPAAVFRLTVSQADLAERLGYRDVWVTERSSPAHGVNPSALALASFLLGRTRRLRVGAIVASLPVAQRVPLAEQASLLDQLSHGRFDLGVGSGFGIDVPGVSAGRFENDVAGTFDAVLAAWQGDARKSLPAPRSRPHPPLFVAGHTHAGIERAARAGAPLLHHWATSVSERAFVEAQYREVANGAGRDPDAVQHVHAFVTWVTDDERRARERLRESLLISLRPPATPVDERRREGPHDLTTLVATIAEEAIVGRPDAVAERFEALRVESGATRFVTCMEPIWVRAALLESVARFATEVMPQFAPEPHPPLALVGQLA